MIFLTNIWKNTSVPSLPTLDPSAAISHPQLPLSFPALPMQHRATSTSWACQRKLAACFFLRFDAKVGNEVMAKKSKQ